MKAWPDYEALPVVFLYRHAVELALKGIAWKGDEIAGRLGKPLSARLWFTKAPRELDAPYSRK
jgi:hypothetical protein